MKKPKNTFLFLAALSLFTAVIIGCEDNEPETTTIEPYFKVRFINQDSINSLKAAITVINADIKAIDALLKAATDATTKETLNAEKDALNQQKTKYNNIITVINSGKMRLTKLSAENGAGELVYEDSLRVYKFPLNTYADNSRFYVTIKEVTDTIDVIYKRETVVNERVVKIQASDFDMIYNSFEDISSIKLSQPDSINFLSNAATATIYY